MDYKTLCEVYQKLETTSKRLEKTHYVAEFLKKIPDKEVAVILLLLEGLVYQKYETEKKIGVAGRLVIKALQVATGIEAKKIEQEWKKTGDLGKVAENFTAKKKQVTLVSHQITIEKVFTNLQKLAELEGPETVEKKVQMIAELLTSATPLEAKYIVRTILEDLRVGVGAGIIRDAIVWSEFPQIHNLDLAGEGNTYYFKEKYKPEKTIASIEDLQKTTIHTIKAIEANNKETAREIFNYFVSIVENAYNLNNDWGKTILLIRKEGVKGLTKTEIELGKPIKVMLYQKAEDIADAFEMVGKPAVFEFKYDGFRCIGGFTAIYVKRRGFIVIRDINIGDYVLTHKGNFKKVLAKNIRTLDKHERLFSIKTFYGQEFKITEKHPILVYRNNEEIWLPPEKIEKKDKLIFPLPKIDIKSIVDKYLILNNAEGYSKKVKISNDFFRFLGYWIGDGFTNDFHNTERIGLIFNYKKDQKLAEVYRRLISRLFAINQISKNIHNGGLYLYWRDSPMKNWLSVHFRREWKGKMLPWWFLGISKAQFEAFLKGWIESDGYIDDAERVSITTKEKDLAMMASILGLKFKRIIGVTRFRVNDKTYYRLIITKNNRGTVFRKDFCAINIQNIQEIKPRDNFKVYNLQVEDDESYCTSMAALHNCQIEILEKNKIVLYTRNFEDVTEQFPDVVDYVKKHISVKTAILEAECVGYDNKTKKYLPFQNISQRIKRKYNIQELAEKFPVEVNIFDTIYINGESMIDTPFLERRKALQKIVEEKKGKIKLSEFMITDNIDEATDFYKKALESGNEGVMAKNLNAPYKPGSRVGFGVKVKPVMESLDLVIVKAEYGEGKRAGWLTSFTIACRDDEGNLLEIGKVSTGIKELDEEGTSYNYMTKLLKPLIKEESGKEVNLKPKIIMEVNFEEIQKSTNYGSGYALRFPRFVRLREDRNEKNASSLSLVEQLYNTQRSRGPV